MIEQFFLKSFIVYNLLLGLVSIDAYSAQKATCANNLKNSKNSQQTPLLTPRVLGHIIYGDLVPSKVSLPQRSYSKEVLCINGGMHTHQGLDAFLKARIEAGASLKSFSQALYEVGEAKYKKNSVNGEKKSRSPIYSIDYATNGIDEVSLPNEALSYEALILHRKKIDKKDGDLNFSKSFFPKTENPEEDIRDWIYDALLDPQAKTSIFKED